MLNSIKLSEIKHYSNTSNTFTEKAYFGRVITRKKLIFTGGSRFDIHYLYPLFSELTYGPSHYNYIYDYSMK